MRKLIRTFIWALAIIGAFNLVQTGWIYYIYNQPENTAFVRDDSIPVPLKKVVCNANAPLGSQLIDMAILSAAAYADEDFPLQIRLSPGWEKLEFTKEDRSSLFPGELISGLKFDFWSNRSKNLSVISFRGTDGLLSWHANFHWITRYLPIDTQYEKIRKASSKLVNWLEDKNQAKHKIYVTGHSLGGGISSACALQREIHNSGSSI